MENENIEVDKTCKFVFVVNGDVGLVISGPLSGIGMTVVECLKNNPEIVKIETAELNSLGSNIAFNFINDGNVNYTLEIPPYGPTDRWIACLSSNPQIIEVEGANPVRAGWVYDGVQFSPRS